MAIDTVNDAIIESATPVQQDGSTQQENPWVKWGKIALAGLGGGATGFAKGFSSAWNGQPVDMASDWADVSENFAKKTKKKQEEVEEKDGVETQNRIETASANPYATYWKNWADNNYIMRG